MKISVDTVLNYLAHLESAYLLRRVRRYDIKGKRHLEVNDKYYLGDKRYFQVCYLLAGAKTEAREFGALSEINDNHPKAVLSMDKDWGSGRDGIRRIYLPDFLLGKD